MRSFAVCLLGAGALAVGCGGGGGSGAASQRVTVSVPVLNALGSYAIVVNDSAGRLVSSTAVTGSASLPVTVPHEGMVSFAAAYATTSYSIVTVVNPPSGTTVRFHDPFMSLGATPTPTPAFQTWNVTVTPVTGATTYSIVGPCGATGTNTIVNPIPITTQSCPTVTSGKILVVAENAGGQPIAWHRTAALPATPGGVTNLAIESDRTDIVTVVQIAQNLPPDTLAYSAELFDLDPSVVYDYSRYQHGGFANINPGQSVALSGYGFPDVGSVRSEERAFGQGGNVSRIRTLPFVPGGTSLDLAGLSYPTTPFFDSPSASLTWEMPLFGSGETMSVFLFNDANTTEFDATAILPAGTTTFAIPQLPAEFLPPDTLERLSGYSYVVAPDVDGVSSYSDYVDHAGDSIDYNYVGQDGTFLIGESII